MSRRRARPVTPSIRDYSIKKKNTLYFYNVLLVPNLTKNLLLISQLPTRFLVNYKFSNVDYCIKEQKTGQSVIIGRCKGDLYIFPTLLELYFSH